MANGAASAKQVATHADLRYWIHITQRLALGALVASILFVGFNVYKAVTLKKQVITSEKRLAENERKIREYDRQIKDREQKLQQLEVDYSKALAAANAPVKQLPIFDQIHPKARAAAVGDQKDSNGNQIYDFSLWLDAPEVVREQINKATYVFDHPTFLRKTQVATDPTNGFEVGYRGWGALRLVTITVQLKNGMTHTYYFDMLKAIGW